MAIDIVRGTTNKPVATAALEQCLIQHASFSGELFIGYPILVTPTGSYPIDALLISRDTGIVVFDLVEGADPGAYRNRQDESYNQIEARLRRHSDLVDRRRLRIEIHPISFAPAMNSINGHDRDYPITNVDSLFAQLSQYRTTVDTTVYRAALSVIESTSTIRKSRTRRVVRHDQSRGAKLKSLEDSIATLDSIQNKAVIETVEGVQRIRGLAGSGKTIVLALKAAYLHAQHPDWRIAVTFNTRSLKGFFRRLINIFCLEQTGEEPNWENVRVINAWGAPGRPERDGIYCEFCRVNNVTYFDFRAAKAEFGSGNPFASACRRAVRKAGRIKRIYDVILVDEAQDFSPAFLQLCYESLKDPKRLIYAYDELQSLTGGSLPSPEKIFGQDATNGSPRVRLDPESDGSMRRDIILEKCYRNSRPVLVTAHALGFGIYRKPSAQDSVGLVQMFDHPQLWEEIGYERRAGRLHPGADVVLARSDATSPSFLESHSVVDDLVVFKVFDSARAQADWLVEKIKDNLTVDELRHDDIIVINPDPLSTRREVGPIRRRLLDAGIECHVAGVDTDPDYFNNSERDSVTFTGIHRAKGNEAGMVYIINAQDCHSATYNLSRLRNRLFTAITRSKSWIRVLGIGDNMQALIDEYERLKTHNFTLEFTYPTEDERERLRIVHRDMSSRELEQLRERDKFLSELLLDLESGNMSLQDLSADTVSKLRRHFGKRN